MGMAPNFNGALGPVMEMMLDTLSNGGGSIGNYGREQYVELHKALHANQKAMGSGQLAKAIAKSTVGYPTQAQAVTSGVGGTSDLAPLVAQSLDPRLVSATVGKRQVKLLNMLAKPTVYNTVHEAMRLNQGGLNDDLPAAFAEGSAPEIIEEAYSRLIGQVKFFGRKFNLTDVARMVGVGGWDGRVTPRGALALKTGNALTGLGAQLERTLFWDDTALWTGPTSVTQALGIDGLYKQAAGNGIAAGTWYNAGLPARIANGDNYYDNRGGALDHGDLIVKAAGMTADPIFGRPNMLLVGPKAYGRFVEQALVYQRASIGTAGSPGGRFTFGPTGGIQFMGPEGPIPVISMPLLPHQQTARATASGTNAPDISGYSITPTSPAGSSATQFDSDDSAGTYIYKLVPVGDKGKGAALTLPSIGVSIGDKVQIDVPDASDQGSGNGKILYYEVFRSTKGGTAATCKFLWRYPTNQDGAASGTRIIDENYHIPGTSPAYLLEFDPDVLYLPTLLPMTRRPLPSVDTTTVMLIMTFFYLHLKQPSKVFTFDNCLEG